MKKIVLAFFLAFSLLISAKDINVGDSISFKISGVPKEEIIKEFEKGNFSIEKIKKDKNGNFLVTVKGFNLGKNNIILGNKNLEIDIKSILTSEDKEIYRNLSDMSNKKLYSDNFPYIFTGSIIIGLLSLIMLIKTFKRGKKKEVIDYDKRFNAQMEILSERWAFDISYALREYIDSRYNSHFLNGNYEKKGVLTDEDIIFIQWLDSCKFSGNVQEEIEASRKKAFDIYKRVKEGEIDV
ncbi:hypothetical protein [uncultured Fusobacterium sp.]|uniref:hypothetical protein n=1 Tax=uncultured Fusobacterium sp. TaxID=159267 RepID=UPI0028045D09|nr:hypothetical protein [uncultured Fusobacterium sp.]